MGKRTNGEHSIYQRGDGRWCAAIVCDDPATGRRTRKVLYGRTRTEVRGMLKAAAEPRESPRQTATKTSDSVVPALVGRPLVDGV